MKHLTKIMTLLLAFLMVISPLAACDIRRGVIQGCSVAHDFPLALADAPL